ncbi:MAG: biopolymer transporter ExbD [Verrucomicrobiales bacterium]|jgi:biopolymer transport protein ExbD|nr:biopolymer transporter ExbD [Verrucomicrobiales bacterium]MBT6450900.1 biopolymer transporter ExbD [Verrucomicrobiales bacterium]|tara:strand:- start:185 stop:601 length:417 start_codon:yes stop_codon:yes gene_type:complete
MRRFSKRNPLVTLADLNVTPMLDLAFVLLIIFVIATPLLEQGMKLELPEGGSTDVAIDRSDVRTVEISRDGQYLFDRKPMNLAQIEAALIQAHTDNPKTIVYIRADQQGVNKDTYAVIDACVKNGLTQFSLRTKESNR